jgi:hypothetical protein
MKRIGKLDGDDLVAISLADLTGMVDAIAQVKKGLDHIAGIFLSELCPHQPRTKNEEPGTLHPSPVRRAARKPDSKPMAKAARPADDSRVCVDCKNPLPPGSDVRRLRCEPCIKEKARKDAATAYRAKHAKKPSVHSASVPNQNQEPRTKNQEHSSPPVSDAARKIAALREAREIEKDRIADIPH